VLQLCTQKFTWPTQHTIWPKHLLGQVQAQAHPLICQQLEHQWGQKGPVVVCGVSWGCARDRFEPGADWHRTGDLLLAVLQTQQQHRQLHQLTVCIECVEQARWQEDRALQELLWEALLGKTLLGKTLLGKTLLGKTLLGKALLWETLLCKTLWHGMQLLLLLLLLLGLLWLLVVAGVCGPLEPAVPHLAHQQPHQVQADDLEGLDIIVALLLLLLLVGDAHQLTDVVPLGKGQRVELALEGLLYAIPPLLLLLLLLLLLRRLWQGVGGDTPTTTQLLPWAALCAESTSTPCCCVWPEG
jgi:hypothetical protein